MHQPHVSAVVQQVVKCNHLAPQATIDEPLGLGIVPLCHGMASCLRI